MRRRGKTKWRGDGGARHKHTKREKEREERERERETTFACLVSVGSIGLDLVGDGCGLALGWFGCLWATICPIHLSTERLEEKRALRQDECVPSVAPLEKCAWRYQKTKKVSFVESPHAFLDASDGEHAFILPVCSLLVPSLT